MRSFSVSVSSLLASGLLLCSLSLVGCDTSTLPDGVVAFVTSPDEDPWSADPAVQHVQLDLVTRTDRTRIADVSAPPDPVSLGKGGPNDVIGHFEATGLSSAGDKVAFGSSIDFYIHGFAYTYVPLFVARTGGFATAPNPLLHPHDRPLSAIGSLVYLLIFGSADTAFETYDPVSWSGSTESGPLPQTVKSVALFESPQNGSQAAVSSLLMVNDDGGTLFDFTAHTTSTASPPSQLTFADIAGGQTLVASDGTIYIVGATRTEGAATNKVLKIDTSGVYHAVLLNTPRLGAAASLVQDTLVVVAGSAKGAGAELLALGDTSFSELDLPADETSGAGLAELTSASVLLAGGHDASGAASATRTIDLGCASDCSATELPQAKLSIGRSSAFQLADNVALVIGETDDEQTHAYLFDATGDQATLIEQPLRAPRSRASATKLPNGQVGIIGGTDLATGEAALDPEVFFP